MVMVALLVACKGKSKSSRGTIEFMAQVRATSRIADLPQRALYVTNNGNDTLSIIDVDGSRVITKALGRDGSTHQAPHHLGFARHGARLLVPFAYPDNLPVSVPTGHREHGRSEHLGQLALLSADTLDILGLLPLEENPGEIAITPDGTRALVTHFDMQRALREAAAGSVPSKLYASLLIFSVEPFARIAARPICVAPHGMAIADAGKIAIVACYGSDELAVVDLTTNALSTQRIPIGGSAPVLGVPRYGPYSVTLNPTGDLALVAELEGNEVRRFDVNHRTFVDNEPLAQGARAMMPCFASDTRAIVPLQSPDGVARLNPKTWVTEKRQQFGSECVKPHVAACSKSGRVYLACEGDHVATGHVVELDPELLTIKRTWTVGVYPDGLALRDD
jgi:DNA-binding beta-propeller fold protein YncE